MKPPIVIGGLAKSGKTAFICSLLLLAQKKGLSCAAFKPFDKGLLKRNALDVLRDGEIYCQFMKGEPMETLVSPYCANEDYPMEMSLRRDGIRIKWSVIQQRLKALEDLYDKTFIEIPASLMTPVTEEMMIIDWLKELKPEIVWLVHPLQESFIQNLFEIKLLKEVGLPFTLVFNNVSQIMDQDLLFYTWEKTEQFASQEAAGMIPFVPDMEKQIEQLGVKIEKSIPGLTEKILSKA